MEDGKEPPDAATGLDEVAVAIRAVLEGDGDSDLSDLLDPSVTWGDCAGAADVLDFVRNRPGRSNRGAAMKAGPSQRRLGAPLSAGIHCSPLSVRLS